MNKINGFNKDNCITAVDAELYPEKLGKRVVIIGGEPASARTAALLAHEGHEVTIVETKKQVAGLISRVAGSADIYTGTAVKCITEDGVLVENEKGLFVIPADTVVC